MVPKETSGERASLLVVDGDCAPGGRRRLRRSREWKPAEAAGAHLSGGGAAARPGPGEAAGGAGAADNPRRYGRSRSRASEAVAVSVLVLALVACGLLSFC